MRKKFQSGSKFMISKSPSFKKDGIIILMPSEKDGIIIKKKKKKLRSAEQKPKKMGRRFGMKKGSGKKFPDLTGDGKVTFADVLKGRGVINGKKT